MLTSISIIEGSLEGKLPTIWTDGKAEVSREDKFRQKMSGAEDYEDQCARKGRKSLPIDVSLTK